MHNMKQKEEDLFELLRAEVATLLCAGHVSEVAKLARIKVAQDIIENGEK